MIEPEIDIEKKIDAIFLTWEKKPWTSQGKDCPSVVDLKNDLKDFYHEMAMVCFNAGLKAGREEERETVKPLVQALRNIKRDIEVCTWNCIGCNSDPDMKETDIYMYAKDALSAYPAPEGKKEI